MHGWIVLDKPVGMTSTHAVAVIKRLFTAKRAGHAGTLDPLASGCLPLALGEATKTVPFVMDGRKRYRFTVRWGEERDTDDAEGRVVGDSRRAAGGRGDPRRCLPAFTGTIAQVPPKFSAIKIEGERAYDLARDGQEVDAGGPAGRYPRPGAGRDARMPIMRFSRPNAAREPMSGRLRAISGRVLGCLGHVSALRRTQVGPFDENDMISLAELEGLCQKAAAGEGSLADALLPVETALDDIPALAVSRADAARLQRGQAVLLRGRDAPIFRGIGLCHDFGRADCSGRSGPRRNHPQARVQPRRPEGQRRQTTRSLTMSITTGRKAEIIKTYATKAGDTGSPEVQVAILSERITTLTDTSRPT